MQILSEARLCLAMILTVFCCVPAGCNDYAWEMFKENSLSPTPYMKAANHPKPREWPNDRLTVTWIGHATVLINFYGTVILTDPVLGERLGPPEFFGVNAGIRRITELPCTFADMPKVDVVLLSHAHHDHWDSPTLRLFDGKTQAIIPTGNCDLVSEGRFGKVTELGWGQKESVGGVEIRAFRVSHWGQRYEAADRPRGFNGYVISGRGRTVVFIGDTAFGDISPDPRATATQPRWLLTPADWSARIGVAKADLCILPVGEYIYRANHMTPEEAWAIFRTAKGRYCLATHWRTFILSPRDRLPTFEPMERLKKIAGAHPDNIICDEPGMVFTLSE
ncbi:MAG: MBL fold metallo-hydrolase [Planctomycetes bacterium]|nr:MBL fold metallo-hydrolase [Planctomycetota bacterium]